MDDEIEHVLCVIREVLVYKVPPRTTARGYRAEEWNNNHVWTGRLRVIAKGNDCAIHLEDSTSGELFAKCIYDLDGTAVEAVVDSSRYFVIKITDQTTGKHAFVGIGFAERSWAFDFNVALQDHVKRVKHEHVPKAVMDQPALDLSLKEGQTISINISGMKKKSSTSNAGATASQGDLNAFMLPPPPGSSSKVASTNSSSFSSWTTF